MNPLIVLLPHEFPSTQPLLCWMQHTEGCERLSLRMAEVAQQAHSELVVLVPASQLSWHVATLAAGVRLKGDTRLLPMLQGLVEESVLDDADQLHVALGPDARGGEAGVLAVCNKAWLEAWMQAMEALGLKVGRCLPEVAPDILGDAAWCTGQPHAGWVTVMEGNAPVTLPLVAHARQLLSGVVCATPALYVEAVQCLGEPQVQLRDEHQALSHKLATRWDLAQHGLAQSWRVRGRRKIVAMARACLTAPQWRVARTGLLALAVAGVLGVHLQALQAWRAVQSRQQAVAQVLRTGFPQLRVIVDAPLQAQREVQGLRLAAGLLAAQDLQPLLAAAGSALKNAALPAPVSLEYDGTMLLLQGLPGEAAQSMAPHMQGTVYRVSQQGPAVRLEVVP